MTPRSLRALVGLVAVAGIALALIVGVLLDQQSLRAGEAARETYRVRSERVVRDEVATEAERRAAEARVPAVFKNDSQANVAMNDELAKFFRDLDAVAAPVILPPPPTTAPPAPAALPPAAPPPATDPGASTPPSEREPATTAATTTTQPPPPQTSMPKPEERYAALRNRYPSLDRSNPGGLVALSGLDPAALASVRAKGATLLQEAIATPIQPDRLATARDSLSLRISAAAADFRSPDVVALMNTLLTSILRPNTVEDAAATAAQRQAARDAVKPVETRYEPGQVLVDRGEVLSPQQVALLAEFGFGSESRSPRVLTVGIATVLLVAVIAIWLATTRPLEWQAPRTLLLLCVVAVAFAAVCSLTSWLGRARDPLWGYLAPAAALAILVCVVTDSGVATLFALAAAVLAGVASRDTFAYAGFVAVAAVAPIPFVSHVSTRGDLLRAVGVAGASGGIAAALFAYGGNGGTGGAGWAFVAGTIGSLVWGVMAIGVLPFFENVFDVLTPTRLLDLTDRNHPLLRELEEKAIGTYNHSIMVGTLAERAARRIGANGLLCRAAAYYHDIGKTGRPYFFIENQLTGDNPHDRITPSQSALIIKEHVSQGVTLAKKYRIPADVAEGIVTHHGTGRIQYFLSKASADGEEVDEDVFRHVGHKPRNREMAILMLADSCEGASRAMAQSQSHRLTPDGVAALVTRIVDQKADDGQLDECSLTFADLADVRASFTETLVGVYHPRIEYPPMPDEKVEPDAV